MGSLLTKGENVTKVGKCPLVIISYEKK
jgi:hypothetical protein